MNSVQKAEFINIDKLKEVGAKEGFKEEKCGVDDSEAAWLIVQVKMECWKEELKSLGLKVKFGKIHKRG